MIWEKMDAYMIREFVMAIEKKKTQNKILLVK